MVEIKPPPLESLVGMEAYGSSSPGIGGIIKQLPEDFVVEEITPKGRVLEVGKDQGLLPGEKKEYLRFTLEKKNWDTMRAIKVISNRLHVGRKRFGFAGTKDKKAVSTQRVSAWNITPEELGKVRIRDIVLRDPEYSDDRINLGDLQANRFTVTIRSLEDSDLEEKIDLIFSELEGRVPNFFGLQRFGVTRPITHEVGRALLERDFQKAVMIYLAEVYEEENPEAREARRLLQETGDFKEALRRFPKHLGYEISMLSHLIKTPTDYIGALRKLPKKLRWMFVHAYQGYVFNLALSRYLLSGKTPESLPLAGYGIDLDPETTRILEKQGIEKEAFKINEMPELSSEGLMRGCFVEINDARIISVEADELNSGQKKALISFELSKGSYATTVLRELLKNEYWKTPPMA